MHADTIALLGQCTAGINLSLSTINGLLPSTKDRNLRRQLQDNAADQQQLRDYACALLHRYGGQEKNPGTLLKAMTRLKNSAHMVVHSDDATIAYLVSDSCDLGVKTLSRSQNRHGTADPDAIRLSQELIRCQEGLSAHLRPYL